MRSLAAVLGLAVLAAALGCGGSSNNDGGGGSGKVIDPSGNWTMTLTDTAGKKFYFSSIFNQVGTVVNAHNFGATPDDAGITCVPFFSTFSNGEVRNGDTFVGTVAMGSASGSASYGTMTFSSTLAPDGLSTTAGSYSGMPACAGVAASGTFSGAQVPDVSGNWTGTVLQCTSDPQGGCTPNGGIGSTMTATLAQHDDAGNVTGTYSVLNQLLIGSGTVAMVPGNDVLSGTVWSFTLTDGNGSSWRGGGTLGLDRKFDGRICRQPLGGGQTDCFQLKMSH